GDVATTRASLTGVPDSARLSFPDRMKPELQPCGSSGGHVLSHPLSDRTFREARVQPQSDRAHTIPLLGGRDSYAPPPSAADPNSAGTAPLVGAPCGRLR